MIHMFYLDVISADERKRARKISDQLGAGKRVSSTDRYVCDLYSDIFNRLHREREALKGEGWDEFRDQAASIDARADGIEKVIYSHWHRVFGVGAPDEMQPVTYAGHWLHAQRNREWFEGDEGRKIFAILCARYPIPRRPLLKDGYSYVWIEPEKPKPRASKRSPAKKASKTTRSKKPMKKGAAKK